MKFAHISDAKEPSTLDWSEFVTKFDLFERHLVSLVGGFLANTEELARIIHGRAFVGATEAEHGF